MKYFACIECGHEYKTADELTENGECPNCNNKLFKAV